MSATVAKIERAQVQYSGHFAEPVFGVLGNPAPLYTNLLRHLASYGASVNDLRTDLSVLSLAHVTCSLPLNAGQVRVSLNKVDVFVPDAKSSTQVGQLVKHAWSALAATDVSLQAMRHSLIVAAWVALADSTFPRFIGRFVNVPSGASHWSPHLELDERAGDGPLIGAVRLESSAGNPNDLFMRLSVDVNGEFRDVEGLSGAFLSRLRAQLAVFDIQVPTI